MSAEARVLCGRWQDRLADLPDASVRLVLTSPPYDDALTYEGTNPVVDFAELRAFCHRVLVPGGVVIMVIDGPVRKGAQSLTPFRTIVEWGEAAGWFFSRHLVYGRRGVPGDFARRFRKDHEHICVFVKAGAHQICHREVFAKPWHPAPGKRLHSRRAYGLVRRLLVKPESISLRGSVWDYGSTGGQESARSGHPATFATRFAEDAVRVWSNPGDLVVDPFAGSGTVGVACLRHGRRFIGADAVAKYVAIAEERLRTALEPKKTKRPPVKMATRSRWAQLAMFEKESAA